MSAIAPARTAPIALWRIAQGFLHILHNLFGAPEDVAFRHTLTRGPYALLLSWLRVGEAMMRLLIAIEAAAFPKPNTRPLLHPARTRKRRAIGFECDKPEDWRVCFRLMERCSASSTIPRHMRAVSRSDSTRVRISSAPCSQRPRSSNTASSAPLISPAQQKTRGHARRIRAESATANLR